VCVDPAPSAVNVTLPAIAAERRRLLHGAQQQTRRPPLLLSIDGTDRRTDGRTLDRYLNRAAHIARAASKMQICVWH